MHARALQRSMALVAACAIGLVSGGAASEAAADSDGYLEALRVPASLVVKRKRPVVVAVVDDGVRATHRELAPFMWTNARERAGNGVDDDGNGYIDDVRGWDVSDADADPAPPDARLVDYYHGTHVAGIVARIARAALGERAPKYVRIMAVKAIGDRAERPYVKDGYAGIEYALAAGADIILCAWSGPQLASRDAAILRRARERGVLIIGAAGNFPSRAPTYPAADPGVLGVTAVDRDLRLAERGNFGSWIDLAAPGVAIEGPDATSDTATRSADGSSTSAAIAAGAAALVSLAHPRWDARAVTAALKNTALPIDQRNPLYVAQLGAGLVQIEPAVRAAAWANGEQSRPQGLARLSSQPARRSRLAIRFPGQVESIALHLVAGTRHGVLVVESEREGVRHRVGKYPLSRLPARLSVPPGVVHATVRGARGRPASATIEWRALGIRHDTRYCRGTVELTDPGELTDGSGAANYAPNTDCKWLITAPRGKVVEFSFSELDTELRTDMIFFFNGDGTHAAKMAIFSGQTLPPTLTTWSNRVLVWFVANGERQGTGWRATYRFRDPPARPATLP